MIYESHSKSNKQPVALVDIDETICFFKDELRQYELAIPNYENIEKINKLHNEGWKIIYWTARGSSKIEDVLRLDYLRELTNSQLVKWGAKFHDVRMGDEKILFDLVIDDKAKTIDQL